MTAWAGATAEEEAKSAEFSVSPAAGSAYHAVPMENSPLQLSYAKTFNHCVIGLGMYDLVHDDKPYAVIAFRSTKECPKSSLSVPCAG